MSRRSLQAFVAAISVAVVLTSAFAACGGDDDDSSAATTSTRSSSSESSGSGSSGDVCKDRDAIQETLDDLRHDVTSRASASAISDDFDQLRDQVEQLKSDAKDKYEPQTNDVRDAADAMQNAVEKLTNDPSLDNVQAVVSQLGGFTDAVNALLDAVKKDCD